MFCVDDQSRISATSLIGRNVLGGTVDLYGVYTNFEHAGENNEGGTAPTELLTPIYLPLV